MRFKTHAMAKAALNAVVHKMVCVQGTLVRATWAKKDSEPKGTSPTSRKSSLDGLNAPWGLPSSGERIIDAEDYTYGP